MTQKEILLLLSTLLLFFPGNLHAACTSGDCRMGTGTYTWDSGSSYSGSWSKGKFEGEGTYTWISGSRYTGAWKNGKKEGKGLYVWPNGDTYDGEWKNDKKAGEGTLTKADGEKYVGHWQNDKKNGQGKNFWKNGDVYTGNWKDDERTGEGTLLYASKDRYEGQWKAGKMQGMGSYHWANGDFYKGEWVNGLRHGTGIQTTALGDKYSGAWKKGVMEGYGIFMWHTGSVYAGNWKANQMIGKGNFTTVEELNRTKPGYLEKLFNPEAQAEKPATLKIVKPQTTPLEKEKPGVVLTGGIKELPTDSPQQEEGFVSSLEKSLQGSESMFRKEEEERSKDINVEDLDIDYTYKVTQRTPLLAEKKRNGNTIKTVVYLAPGETFTVIRKKKSKEVVLYIVIFHNDVKGWINSRTLTEKNLIRVGSSSLPHQ